VAVEVVPGNKIRQANLFQRLEETNFGPIMAWQTTLLDREQASICYDREQRFSTGYRYQDYTSEFGQNRKSKRYTAAMF
jgi:hypothetical protein